MNSYWKMFALVCMLSLRKQFYSIASRNWRFEKRMTVEIKATIEEICLFLIQLLTWRKHPNKNDIDLSRKYFELASILIQYIKGNRTRTCINLDVGLCKYIRSKEFVDNWHSESIIIDYADNQLLYDKWALENMKI